MEETRIKPKQRTRSWKGSDRADRAFAAASIALMVFMAAAGLGVWIFGNSGEAADINISLVVSLRKFVKVDHRLQHV